MVALFDSLAKLCTLKLNCCIQKQKSGDVVIYTMPKNLADEFEDYLKTKYGHKRGEEIIKSISRSSDSELSL